MMMIEDALIKALRNRGQLPRSVVDALSNYLDSKASYYNNMAYIEGVRLANRGADESEQRRADEKGLSVSEYRRYIHNILV
ncbi:MAG: hypothetical protein ABIA21_03310 [Candidatus Aenigmatarchaeota archaeon]